MLTKAQQETLEAVEAFITGEGYSPTILELGMILGISQNAVYERLCWLRKKGAVDWKDGQSRTLHVVKGGVSNG